MDVKKQIKRTFETVFFTTVDDTNYQKTPDQTVELTINRDTKEFSICESSEESVRFDNVSLKGAEMKLIALESALKYAKENL